MIEHGWLNVILSQQTIRISKSHFLWLLCSGHWLLILLLLSGWLICWDLWHRYILDEGALGLVFLLCFLLLLLRRSALHLLTDFFQCPI